MKTELTLIVPYGNLISQSRGGVDSFYLFDGLGSTRQLVNSTGSVTDSYLYDSWGNILLTSGTTINWFRYIGVSGYYFDIDLAKNYLRARMYDPATGRFLSRDPIGLSGGDVNFYKYVGNMPVRLQDPGGLIVLYVLAGLAVAAAACAYPFYRYAHDHYGDSGDKFKHCWVSCQMSRACTGLLAQLAGLGKESIDILRGLIGYEKYPGLADSLGDIIANQQCVHWESYIPVCNLFGYFRESCYDCCSRNVGYTTTRLS